MSDYCIVNRIISDNYNTRVPNYDLTPVLKRLAGIEPKNIADAMAEAIISITDDLLLKNRKSNLRTQATICVLKAVYRTFNDIRYDHEEIFKMIDEQIMNKEGIYEEPDVDYINGRNE